jgi:hypothetical protein
MIRHSPEVHAMHQKPASLSGGSCAATPAGRFVCSRLVAIFIALIFGTSAGRVFAGVQVITNPSFETNTLADGASTVDTIFAWSGTGTFGALNPTSAQYAGAGGNVLPGPGTDGANVAYIDGNSSIFQTLSLTLAANTTYSVTGAIGDPAGSTFGTAYAQLVAGSTLLDNLNISDPGAGTFATWTLTYSSSDSQPDLGQTLEIILGNSATGSSTVVNFDNIGLITTTPEPTTLALGVLGLGALAAYRLRVHPKFCRYQSSASASPS